MEFAEFTNKSVEDVFAELGSSVDGISEKEAVFRQKKFGLNEIKAKGNNFLDILIRQFKSPFFYLLFIAAVIALFIGEKTDSIVILVFVAANVAIGFFQEFRAERAVQLLKKFIPQKARVVRSGREAVVEKKFLVSGDVVLLESGSIVPAELRVLNLENFLVDESALTGESVPVPKISESLKRGAKEVYQAENILFTGTLIVSGKAKGVVIATGNDTALGEVSKLILQPQRQSTYEKDLLYFCRLVLRIVVVTIILVFLLGFFIKGPENIFDFALFCVALIVSILPEALPAVVVLAMSRGSLQMAKEKVVVKRLSAIEDLGNIEILAADKTGTLTQNKLSLEKIVTSDRAKCFLYGVLSSKNFLNPFDLAISKKASNEILSQAKKFNVISELTFDSFRMRSSVIVEGRGERVLIVKGSPESILKYCTKFNGRFTRPEIMEDTGREGSEGKRVLALAYKKLNLPKRLESSPKLFDYKKSTVKESDERGLTFLGYFVFEDPLKSTAYEAIKLSKKLGIKIKIITGDSKEVAGYVAKKVGLVSDAADDIVSADQLGRMTPEEFEDACEKSSVFARISPSLKHKIIKSLQKRYDVGFMGEGINDAPALKIANVGIAVAEATDIARESADVVLLQKDLRVVVNGIKNGRTIFANINKYIKCALSNNFGNFYSIAVISLFINFLPMLPVQVLLGNLLSDFPLISIATDSVDIEELKKPKAYQLHNVLPLIIFLGMVASLFDFIFYSIFKSHTPEVIQSLWFIETIFTEIFLVFIIRTRGFFWKAKKPSNTLLFLTIIDGLAIILLPFTIWGHKFFHFVSPPLSGLLLVIVIVIAYFAVNETVKLIYFRYWTRKNSMVG